MRDEARNLVTDAAVLAAAIAFLWVAASPRDGVEFFDASAGPIEIAGASR